VKKQQARASERTLEQVLTQRQLQVLRCIVDGQSTKQTAYKLGLSVKTVETYRRQIMQRTGMTSVAMLVRLAIRKGFIEP
jgi:DNA-binding CsgD family transcriptional regulator